MTNKYKYIICSDFHLGSEVCQRDKIIKFLHSINTDNLILNGDIIDVSHTKRLNKKDWKILSVLRKISKNTNVIYLTGNHELGLNETLSELLGFTAAKYYEFQLNNKKFYVIHGDVFDSIISEFWLLTEIATGIYYWIQRLGGEKQAAARMIKRKSKNFIKCCERMKNRAEHFACSHNIFKIICGHSHSHFISNESSYVNCGCFTEVDCTYIAIDESGKVELQQVN